MWNAEQSRAKRVGGDFNSSNSIIDDCVRAVWDMYVCIIYTHIYTATLIYMRRENELDKNARKDDFFLLSFHWWACLRGEGIEKCQHQARWGGEGAKWMRASEKERRTHWNSSGFSRQSARFKPSLLSLCGGGSFILYNNNNTLKNSRYLLYIFKYISTRIIQKLKRKIHTNLNLKY